MSASFPRSCLAHALRTSPGRHETVTGPLARGRRGTTRHPPDTPRHHRARQKPGPVGPGSGFPAPGPGKFLVLDPATYANAAI
ncbi:hypothetical protein ABZ348_14260 [Streptomyces sp. NPDC005963]|uniref:hypothetical protein n=1 Tax=Streptomyces sp. NPDC005963 TaxID=3156721 RepID=UPI0033DE9CC3